MSFGEFPSVDKRIAEIGDLLNRHWEFPNPTIEARVVTSMLVAMTLWRPQHPDIKRWAERLQASLQQNLDIRFRGFAATYLTTYYLWVGDYAKARSVVDALARMVAQDGAPPLARVIGKVIEAVYHARAAEHARCLKVVSEGLEIADESGVHAWDGQFFSQATASALSVGDYAAVDAYLPKMEASLAETRRIDICMYHQHSAWYALLKRDLVRAAQHVEQAMQLALQCGAPFHEALAHVGFTHRTVLFARNTNVNLVAVAGVPR